jgi:CubicO group peptidase (beta-lactamase class C family)
MANGTHRPRLQVSINPHLRFHSDAPGAPFDPRARRPPGSAPRTIFVINSIPSTGGTRAQAGDRAIEAYVDAQVADAGYPGASLAVIRGGHVTDLHPIGAADASGRPVSAETPFVIGSLSKSLTALAVMRLVEAGRVELDAPVTRYLPGFRTATTGRDADHRPPAARSDQRAAWLGDGSQHARLDPCRARSPRLATVEPASAPGIRYAYANANYVVLGGVIEAASGRPTRTRCSRSSSGRSG